VAAAVVNSLTGLEAPAYHPLHDHDAVAVNLDAAIVAAAKVARQA
jgi:hypothetical protein